MARQSRVVWLHWRGKNRARFWRTQGFANLRRATVTRWVLYRRHWPESCLPEFMADLEPIADPGPDKPRGRGKKTGK